MMMRYEMYLNVETLMDTHEVSIDNGKGAWFTLEEAKQHWNNGEVIDCNLGFKRLANNDFDVGRTVQDYIEMDSL